MIMTSKARNILRDSITFSIEALISEMENDDTRIALQEIKKRLIELDISAPTFFKRLRRRWF